MAGPPIAAGDVLGTGSIVVHVAIGPYWPGVSDPFEGAVECESMAEPAGFAVWLDGPTGDSGPIDIEVTDPAGQACWIESFWPPESGVGEWGGVDGTGGTIIVGPGEVVDVWVSVERTFAGADWDLWVDDYQDANVDLLTIDRVWVNRYGGITAEGRLWCPTAQDLFPGFQDIVLNVNWDATQYIGRKTAITARYESYFGSLCDETPPPVWQTMKFAPGGGAEVGWIYSTSGKFATGSIHVEAEAYGGFLAIAQWWDPDGDRYDPTCSTEPNSGGWVDNDGDGFCVTEVWLGTRAQADLKAVRAR
jgi:hypothetical protein